MDDTPLWQPDPDRIRNSQLTHFIHYLNQHHALQISHYAQLHAWSIQYPEYFWQAVCTFCRIYMSVPASQILQRSHDMQQTRWFIDAKLNFAQNLLRYRDAHPALLFLSERGDDQSISYAELFIKVTRLAHILKQLGIKPGDRVAGVLPNIPETVIAMLATTSLGAIWSACSSEFGLEGLISRFSQIEPRLLFAADGHYYGGKTFNHLHKIIELQKALPSIEHTIIVPMIEPTPNLAGLHHAQLFPHISNKPEAVPSLEFAQLPFDHPVYILYSSGTTGKPKCMVHSAGGTLIQHLKELILHTNVRREDRIFFYTTCTWMMWHWLISNLAVGATVILYEGSTMYPQPTQLFDLIDQSGISICGVGAKFLESAENIGLHPKNTHALTSLHTLLTTGSPLLPESFDYVYHTIKPSVQLSSISGGSDIISCFALGNPNLPVYRGELQCIGLGMDVKIFNSQGKAVIDEKGELVCASAFPSMPIYFWNDPHGEKYHQAYFEKFPHVWTHGDYAKLTVHGGLIIYGRSDATLNPSGVRIGTAEIYQEVEKFSEIYNCAAVGKQTPDGEMIILFVVLAPNTVLDPELIQRIKQQIRSHTSPMHVPAKIFAVPDLPRTINNKVMELAIKKVIHGETIDNLEAIINPECLDFFKPFRDCG